jgi:hypothetical protein
MKFISPKFIRLRHCDSASIVFYPQSYYLPHETQDDFFSHIGFPLHDMIIQCNIDYAIFGVNKQKTPIASSSQKQLAQMFILILNTIVSNNPDVLKIALESYLKATNHA